MTRMLNRPDLIPLKTERTLSTLVENRHSYTLSSCELNIFETHRRAEQVNLLFQDMVFTSMLRGKKVMHLFEKPGFDYFPGESLILPPNERMVIDFPDARSDDPTQCIALAISGDQISHTLDLLNERFPRSESADFWHIRYDFFHLNNNMDLTEIVNRIIRISIQEKSREKDLLAELALRELLIRLMQTQAREVIEKNYRQLSNEHRFAHVVSYIKSSFTEKIDMDKLCEKACMSRASFFRKFKMELGQTPGDYINTERIRFAMQLLGQATVSITEACYKSGYNNLNYFSRLFKKMTGLSPSDYQKSAVQRGIGV